mmetsp:Transcript_24233/g.60206  ORF Transcript_24233/g.60206 Transcript_24233/m.60206 type:complete len:403 (+) Transcript_24233:127-1335(+)
MLIASLSASRSTYPSPNTASHTRTAVSSHPAIRREWSNATERTPSGVERKVATDDADRGRRVTAMPQSSPPVTTRRSRVSIAMQLTQSECTRLGGASAAPGLRESCTCTVPAADPNAKRPPSATTHRAAERRDTLVQASSGPRPAPVVTSVSAAAGDRMSHRRTTPSLHAASTTLASKATPYTAAGKPGTRRTADPHRSMSYTWTPAPGASPAHASRPPGAPALPPPPPLTSKNWECGWRVPGLVSCLTETHATWGTVATSSDDPTRPRPTPEAPSQPPPPLPPVACLLSPPPPLSPLPSPPPSSPPPSSSSRHGSTPTLRTSHTRISPPAVELSSNEGGGGAHEVSGDSEALCLPPSPNSRQHVTVSLCPTHRANTRSQPPSRGVGGSRRPRGGSPMTASD